MCRLKVCRIKLEDIGGCERSPRVLGHCLRWKEYLVMYLRCICLLVTAKNVWLHICS